MRASDNNSNRKYLRIGLTIFFTFMACALFYYFLFRSEDFFSAKDAIIHGMLPVIDGLFIAYFLNPIMKYFEEKCVKVLWKKSKKLEGNKNSKKYIRLISLTITMILFILIIFGLFMMIVPQLVDSIQSIILRFPTYMKSADSWFSSILADNPGLQNMFNKYWPNFEGWFVNEIIPTIKSLISYVSSDFLGSVFEVLNLIFDFIIGIIISVYLLYNKEIYAAHAKKVVYAFMSETKANNLINNTRFANKTFGEFLSGKLVDSLIIGIICFICISIMRIPYSLLISVIIGVTNVIPFFGPFLGAIPSVFFLLMIDPIKALVFAIFVFILQQFDGNILGPKILGDSTGLSSFWVIFAITVFGALFGVLGMFIGVPLFAILYSAFKTFINQKLDAKGMPHDTAFYLNSDYKVDKDSENSGKEFKIKKVEKVENTTEEAK